MKDRRKHIVIVYEGAKTEKALIDNLPQVYKNKDVVKELLDDFDNETENGKLYISYPMLESLREINSVSEDYKESIPEYDYFLNELTQKKIYEVQLERFVKLNKMVGVLNSVPLFLLEYFKIEFWNEVMLKNQG